MQEAKGDHKFNPMEQDANIRAFLYFNKNVKGFYVSEDDFIRGVNRGWDFFNNPLNIDGSNARNQYVDYQNHDHLISLNRLKVRAKWYDHASWFLLPVGGPLWIGLINAKRYNNH